MEVLEREAKEAHRQRIAEWGMKNKEKLAERKSTMRRKRKTATKNIKEEDLFQDPLEMKEKYGCSICGETFAKFAHRDLHELQVHSSDGWVRRVECDKCDKSFSNRFSLNRHKSAEHLGLRLECEECPATFARDSALEYHNIYSLDFSSYHTVEALFSLAQSFIVIF